MAPDEIPFYIADMEDISAIAAKSKGTAYAFILVDAAEDGLLKIDGNCYVMGVNENSFFDIIFKCFFLFPLADSFSLYAHSLMRQVQNKQLHEEIRLLLSVKPVIRVSIEERIELGCSVPIKVDILPPGSKPPELTFEYQLPGIVSCTQQRVFGEREGKVAVKVFEKGEVDALATFTFSVFKRNRIEMLSLSEKSRVMGCGDHCRIDVNYSPPNADNVDSIQWYSENKAVAAVNSRGEISAISPGTCKIFCAAEKVAQCCVIQAKPYLTAIKLPSDIVEGSLQIAVGEKKRIRCATEPENAYDSKLIYSSSNLMVLNVAEDTIIGVSDGEATLVIANGSGRQRESIRVVVGRGNAAEKKKGWFSKFFKR